MISCTEFIPAYSQLFTFLEENYGRGEVDRFWEYLFEPTGDGIPLINYLKREGLRGCYSYWGGTLNEEAADFSMYLNERDGWFKIQMHRCPSKGRLLELKDSLGLIPYHDYCLHCDHYRESAEQMGLRYIYDFCNTDKAGCSILIYDPAKFTGKLVVDEQTEVTTRCAADNEYFHMDFHSSLNMAMQYVGEKFGTAVLTRFLTEYTEAVYQPVFAAVQAEGLPAIARWIADTYRTEKSEAAVTLKSEENRLTVTVHYCPAVKHLRATGRQVSPYYSYSTSVVMAVVAGYAGAEFALQYYDEETGAAQYTFTV